MGAGKILILIGALLTLVSTFFFSLFHLGGNIYGYGVGFIFNIPNIMEHADAYAFLIGTETMADEKVGENIEAVVKFLEKKLPKGRDNIKNVFTKL